MKKAYKYQLPKGFKIQDSEVEGQGLFSTHNRAKGNVIGEGVYPTHVHDKRFDDAFGRTALGTFINHSDNPNFELVLIDDAFFLKTIKQIKVGDEVTVKYGKLGIAHSFFKMSPEQEKHHKERMDKAKSDVIMMGEVWVDVEDKESVRVLAGEILNGAIVMDAWDDNIKEVFIWIAKNGYLSQPVLAKKYLVTKVDI